MIYQECIKSRFGDNFILAGHYYGTAEAYVSEKFSEKALEILRLQAEGLVRVEIAAKLGISLNTVKYHCKENYSKLGVNNRRAAVLEAKRRGLI